MVMVTAVVGYFLYGQSKGYTYLSDWHTLDLIRSKLWTIVWILISATAIYFKRKSPYAPALAVLAVSVYFVILYGMLFRGTEYGMNGHWGDNGNRLAEICKMMAYNSPFQDWYLKDLPSFYPPGWFILMALYAKVLGLEAYNAIKFGYLLIFLAYPWLLYFSWKKVVSPTAAAAAAIATLFFATKFLDWIYYEHLTASLFVPWWLHFFEGGHRDIRTTWSNWRFYLSGAVCGGLLFVTYYYWFFMAAAVLPFTLGATWLTTRSFDHVWKDLRHKTVLMALVAIVSSPFWFPLLLSIGKHGLASAQNVFFGLRHTNLAAQWDGISIESLMILAGVFFAFYCWHQWGRGKLPYLFLGGLLLIIVDRFLNTGQSSFQSRKILEFVHVFAAAPAGIGLVIIWKKLGSQSNLKRGIVGIGLLICLIVADSHVAAYTNPKYKTALKQRVPTAAIEIMQSVPTDGTVFLTNRYIEACYLPYYMFIPINNMSAHTAGRYDQREAFLDRITEIAEPDLLAYALGHNKYDRVDYFYLPRNKTTQQFELKINQTRFGKKAETKTLTFASEITDAPDFFVKRHDRGVYQVVAEERNAATDALIEKMYPGIAQHLANQEP